MTFAIRGALLAVAVLGSVPGLSGCAGMYGGIDGGRGGLNHIGAVKRGENLYDVVWLGKDASTSVYKRDMALLQSAKLCKDRGYSWFKASDTSAWSTFSAQPSPDAPQLTLQVSCFDSEDADSPTLGVDKVIARVTGDYKLSGV